MDVRLLTHLSVGYHGRTQVARVLTENWVEREGYCTACAQDSLERLRANAAVRDFRCPSCGEPYQLKAKASVFGPRVADGAYSAFYHAVVSGNAPNFFLLRYDRDRFTVEDFLAIHRKFISPLSVLQRRPLAPTARRAGWIGCNIDLSAVPSDAIIPLVHSGNPVARSVVRKQWKKFDELDAIDKQCGWLRDVLSCVQILGQETFTLGEIYTFEGELSSLHPGNRNVQPKIRQQLQLLCRQGMLERVRPGLYRRIALPGRVST